MGPSRGARSGHVAPQSARAVFLQWSSLLSHSVIHVAHIEPEALSWLRGTRRSYFGEFKVWLAASPKA